MSAPSIVNDGVFTVEAQNGAWKYTNPLADKGDFSHIVAKRKVRIDVSSYASHTTLRQLSITTGNAVNAVRTVYLVGISEPDLAGNNLLEWEESYATIPATRLEPTSITYSRQVLWYTANADQTTTVEIKEFTDKYDAFNTYEYYLNTPSDPWERPLDTLRAPRLEQVGNHILFKGGWRPFLDGEQVLAEDSSTDRYLGDIFVRKSTRIKWVEALPFTPPVQPPAGTFSYPA